jgi:exopolysaccharide biosynthesis polyprenyl glycosylphosphotransferase
MSILEPTSDSTARPVVARTNPPRVARLTKRRWIALAPVADALVLTLAVVVERLAGRSVGANALSPAWIVAFPAIAISLLATGGLYRSRLKLQLLDDLRTIAGATAIASMATIALPVVAGANTAGLPAQGVRLWLFATVYLTASRAGIISSIVAARVSGFAPTPTVIVGAGSVGRLLAKRLEEHPEIGLAPIGFLDKDPRQADPEAGGRTLPVLGASWDLGEVIDTHGVEHVLFTFSSAPHQVMLNMLEECTQRNVRVTIVPRLFERMPRNLTVDYLGGVPLVSIHPSRPGSLRFRIKYALDRVIAGIALLVLLPALLVISLGVLLSVGRPVLFRQARVGRDNRAFKMLKFRTMAGTGPEAEVYERPRLDVGPGGVEGDDRRTTFGAFLRRTSLDELPQLLNVVKGDMSLVGPRPERPEFVEVFRDQVYRYSDRHRVKSGITGWAQINGLRGKTSLADRVEWDNWYIENCSIGLDVKILFSTVLAVFRSPQAE